MQKPAPHGVDISTPNVARMWDYALGGKNNYAADREAAERIWSMLPEARLAAQVSRKFLTRVVQHLTAAGINQFIDIGSGLPTQGNVHEVAQEANPAVRVAYVDYDPVVCAHGRALLERSSSVAVVQGDLRQPEAILNHADLQALIDLDEPVAVLLIMIVHFLPDEDDPAAVIGNIRDAIAPGSYLALTHGTQDALPGRDQAVQTTVNVYRRSTASIISRSRKEVLKFFDGFGLVDPGLVWVAEWGVEETGEHPERSLTYAGVGRKP